MVTSTTFGSFLVAATLASGAALPSTRTGSFKIERSANPQFTGRNGPLALARAYAKYGAAVPKNVAQAANRVQNSRRDSGSATATPDSGDLEYLVKVDIGTPAQSVNLDFDTGSSDLWVFTDKTGNTGSHDIYKPGDSSSAKKLSGASWSISYGDGSSASGDVYTDTVTVGSLTVKSQAVEEASTASSEFLQGNNDGLLGLAFSSINTVQPQPQKTWFDNASANLDQPLFVADLKHNAPGSYTFGAIPSEAGDVSYAPVDDSQGFWQFSTDTDFGSIDAAIADTGTTLLLTDDSIVEAYYKKVSGAENDSQQGGYVYDCDTDLPDFTFSVGDGKITVPGSLINYGPVSDGSSQCFGGIQSAGGIGLSIFGDIALKAAYVVFDAGNSQVGWAQKQ